ncbi:MAG: 4Fe-4S dicluster domain-containing protein [Vulcanimicrobiota bacterium]
MSSKGFFTDTSLCIGCKACEVACKEWNQLPADGYDFTAMSYDNTGHLGASTWRHVAFVERPAAMTAEQAENGQLFSWLMHSDVCKHCNLAGCLENCPTGAIIRTEFDTVYVQSDICNGCGYCVSGCPFGVIDRRGEDGRAWKCTMCYDRLKDDQQPACAKACPTQSIRFGELDELQDYARERVKQLHGQGRTEAYLYGTDTEGTGPLNAFFLLTERPELYNLPPNPTAPQKTVGQSWQTALLAALGMLAVAAFSMENRHER